MTDQDRLITAIKEQAEIFILDAGEFYPFATYIDTDDKIVPLGVYLDNDFPSVKDVLDALDDHLEKLDFKAAIIAIDVRINRPNLTCNAVQMIIHIPGEDTRTSLLKYDVEAGKVVFEPLVI